jgi:hypothetical protein
MVFRIWQWHQVAPNLAKTVKKPEIILG